MPALESHTGLLATTIPFYNRRNFVNVSNTLQHYPAFSAIVRNMKRSINNKWTKFQFGLPTEVFGGGGTSFKFNLQVTSRNGFTWVSADDPVSMDKRDFQVQGELPWRLARVMDFTYEDWELSASRGKEEIINLITQRTLGNEQGAADGFENWFWGTPPTSTDDKTAFPMRYFLYSEPESVTGSYTSFTGINAGTTGNLLNVNHGSYTSGPFGQSRATYRTLGNWNAQYTTFNDTDFVEKFSHFCMDAGWESPVDFPNLVKEEPMRACYTTKANKIIKGRLARQQNDQNGSDLTSRITDTEIYSIPFYNNPIFEDTNRFSLYSSSNKDVVYCMDWNTWHWASKTGFRMEDKVFGPTREAPHHHTHARFLGGQLVCLEPRRNGVLSK